MNRFWSAADSAPDPLAGILVQYGAVGAIALMALFAVRVLFARLTTALDQQTQRADRLEEELRKLNETIRSEYIKAISDANRAVAETLATVRRS